MNRATIAFEEERLEIFPTRIFRRKYTGLEGLNDKLREIILARKAASPKGVCRSNVGGWHSDSDLLRWHHPEMRVLLDLYQSVVVDYMAEESQRDPRSFELDVTIEAWANVTQTGQYMRPHVHPMCNLSVVYYVDCGDDAETKAEAPAGCLEVLDPRNRPHMIANPGIEARDSMVIRPETGVMLIFPAWLYHHVHPYAGERPRISIAANATIQRMKEAKKGRRHPRPSARIIEEV